MKHPDIKSGAVIASPSKTMPDYFAHWSRDAAMVENALYEVYLSSHDNALRSKLIDQAKNWLRFEINAQKLSLKAVAGIGEPKYQVDGTVITYPWGRPQDDGPALRARAAMQWTPLLGLKQSDSKFSKEIKDLVQNDLTYLEKRISEPSFDIWEEINATHFFTRVVQLSAFKKAALFYKKDYNTQIKQLRNQLKDFIVDGRNYVSASIHWVGGWKHKKTQLDTSVLIAANMELFEDEIFDQAISSKNKKTYAEYLTTSAMDLEKFFRGAYQINANLAIPTAMGRYPEDVYTGITTDGPSNPWFITTHATAEFYCKLAKHAESHGDKVKGELYRAKGKDFFARTLLHKGKEGEMSEQYSRKDGTLMGANNLTWSYASFITAYLACRTP